MIEAIKLKSFRKHENMSLDFDEKFNLIHGRNNAGKTTVFYAIEYCLFGGVLGFKKISQLTSFKSKTIGVELIFRSRNGDRFKLQRMHKLVGKTLAAKGSFTLKKLSDDGESYIMASDFGDREEDLSLKINELTGISKRFFETGIHFHQGTISEILNGSKKLDIVFGITAATTLADIFKTRALSFEKEVLNAEKVEIQLNQSKKNKVEQEEKSAEYAKKIDEVQNTILTKEGQLKSLQKMEEFAEIVSEAVGNYENAEKKVGEIKIKEEVLKKEFQEVKDKFGSKKKIEEELNSKLINLDKVKQEINTYESKLEQLQNETIKLEKEKIENENKTNNLKEISKELETLTNELGSKEQLQEKLKLNSIKVKEISKKISKLESESESLLKSIRDSERAIGDYEGMLNRRKNSKDKPICEYCGAPIDPVKIEDEIKNLQNSLKEFKKKISQNEKKEEKIKGELAESRTNEKEVSEEAHIFETSVQQIESLANKQKKLSENMDLDKNLKSINLLIEKNEESIKNEKKELSISRSDENDLNKRVNVLESQLTQFEDLEQKVKKINIELISQEKYLQEELERLIKNFNDTHQNIKIEITEQMNKYSGEEIETFANEVLQVTEKLAVTKDNFAFDKGFNVRDELKELILAKNSEIKATLDVIKNQFKEIEEYLSGIQNQIMKLDKEIASYEKQLNELKNKERLAQNYRKFQNNFQDVQNIIRQNASKVLEQKILAIHKNLSADDEFEKVSIDSDNYSLSVLPKGIESDELYPAMVYQGGGHKLILGLSYKIALGDLIGAPPFLLIDEPTEFMDSNNRITLLSNLSAISDKSQVLLITHQDVDKIQANKKIEILKT